MKNALNSYFRHRSASSCSIWNAAGTIRNLNITEFIALTEQANICVLPSEQIAFLRLVRYEIDNILIFLLDSDIVISIQCAMY